MFRKTPLILIILVLALLSCVYADSTIPAIEPIRKSDRVLILAPHPDDEAIGCAGIIQEAVAQGAKVKVAYLTNGDSNQLAFIVYEKRLTFKKGEFIHMGEVRRKEATAAMQLLGVNEKDLVFLGYPDFGTFAIFMSHWQDRPAFRSLFTKANSVPYKENFSYGKPYKGESILADLKAIIKEYRPNKIFVTQPADTNGDHRALYLFLQVALSDLGKAFSQPKIYPYLIHCVGWPTPRHYHPELPLLPPKQYSDSPVKWSHYSLSPESLDKKHKAILAYKSQTESSAFYLLAFARRNELFGNYPEINLFLSGSAKDMRKRRLDSFISMIKSGSDAKSIIEDQGRVTYSLSADTLLIRLAKTKDLKRNFSVLFYLFGYSSKTPFGRMPKISIVVHRNRLRVFEGKKTIRAGGISSESNSREFTLKVPLKVLGDPDFILSLAKKYKRVLPMDTLDFHKINIRR